MKRELSQQPDWNHPTPRQAMRVLFATMDGGPTPARHWEAAIREIATLTPKRVAQITEELRAAERAETEQMLSDD